MTRSAVETHSPSESFASAERAAVWLRQVNAAFTLLLIAVTWRLWTPQDVYPQVPFVGGLIAAPGWIDLVAFEMWVIGLILALPPRRFRRMAACGLAMAVVGGVSLILLDQHRLQPWAFLSLLVSFGLLTIPPTRAVVWLRLLIISVYVHSAISKLDYSFLHSHGRELCDALLAVFGASIDHLGETPRTLIALSLPVAELLIAAGLCTRRFRRAAVWLSVSMHLLLLLALGPLGWNHKPAVLLWNAQFIVQNLLLFRDPRKAAEDETAANAIPSTRSAIGARCGVAVTIAAVVLPFLKPFGCYDHWPAWALYVSRPERVTVTVHVLSREKLPAAIREQTAPPRQLWCEVHIDRWSLDALDAPIYPQARFRIAVALALAEQAELKDAVRVIIESPANRWNGNRNRREIRGIENLRREAKRYWVNTRGR